MYHQRDNYIKCTALPGGSFPQIVNIEGLDEFDFVFILESESKSLNIDEWVELLLLGDTRSLAKEIERLLRKSINENLFVVEMKLLQKGHCVNFIISWICSYKHKHSLSLDISISIKTSTKLQDIFREVNFPLTGTPFENSIGRNDNVYWNSKLNGKIPGGRIDTNIFDQQLFYKYDDISSNIKLCFRLVKFICAHTFPYDYKGKKCQFKKEEKRYHKPAYSSFILKQLLYKEVNKFSSSEHWKNVDIFTRIASILENFISGDSLKELIAGDFPEGEKSTLGGQGKLFQNVLTGLIEFLHESEVKRFSKPKMLSNINEIVLVASDIIVKASESTVKTLYGTWCGDTWCDENFSFYKFGLFAPNLIENSVFCGIYQTFDGVIDDVKKVDLVGYSEYELQKFLSLVNVSIITKEDTDAGNYTRKLNSFNQILEFYGIPLKEVFDPKLDISYEYLPKPTKLIKRAEILKQISWEKAGAIYKNPQELSTLQLTKNASMIQSILKSGEHWNESTEYRLLFVKLSFQECWLLASLNYIENIK